jgi:transposase
MAMLADLVELARRGRHPQGHPHRGGRERRHRSSPGASHVSATPAGYQQLLKPAGCHQGQRMWAIEGTGGYGAGLTRFLHAHAEQVVELDRPKRAARRHGARSDPIDAARAAREALGRDQLAQPRAAGQRAALPVRLTARRSAVQAGTDAQRQLHALVVAAPDALRSRLRGLTTPRLVSACGRLRLRADLDSETAATAASLRAVARRIQFLDREIADHTRAITLLVRAWRPDLLTRCGWARSWPPSCSVPGRMRAAAAPMPPSPCWAGPPPSPRPPDRPFGFASTGPATASSTRPCTWSS